MQISHNDLTPIVVFMKVAEERSFTAAARELGLSKATISKHVSGLETRLGLALLKRSTRMLTLTPAGAHLYARGRGVIDELGQVEHELLQFCGQPREHLRVHTPLSFGHLRLAPLLHGFLEQYAHVSLDLSLSDECAATGDRDADLYICVAAHAPSGFRSVALAQCEHVVCAAPSYLQRSACLRRPEDLHAHNCLVYRDRTEGRIWRLRGSGGDVTVEVDGIVSANNGDCLRQLLVAGFGVGLMPDFLVEDDLAAGRLVDCLPGYRNADYRVYALLPASGTPSAATRLLIDYLAEALQSGLPEPPAAVAVEPMVSR